MISIQRLPRDQWERRLRSYGCYPADGLTVLNTAEWWRWPFPAPPFTVPVDADDYCDTFAFMRLLSDMARLAPPNWVFKNPTEL